MSKLFDTLEKIREHETSSRDSNNSRTQLHEGTSKKPNKVVVATLLVAIIVVGVYGLLPVLNNKSTVKKHVKSPPVKRIAPELVQQKTSPAKTPTLSVASETLNPVISGSKTSQSFAGLNKRAVQYIKNNQHWKGVYYLQEAIKKEPKRVEALVNIAVAYAELGLTWKAIDYFEKAYEINSKFKPLLLNMKILDQANLLESELLSEVDLDGYSMPNSEVD